MPLGPKNLKTIMLQLYNVYKSYHTYNTLPQVDSRALEGATDTLILLLTHGVSKV